MSHRWASVLAIAVACCVAGAARADEPTDAGAGDDALPERVTGARLTPLMVAFEAPNAGVSAELLRVRFSVFQFSQATASYVDVGHGQRLVAGGLLGFGARVGLSQESDEIGFLTYVLSGSFRLPTRAGGRGLTKLYYRHEFHPLLLEVGAEFPLLPVGASGLDLFRGYVGTGLAL